MTPLDGPEARPHPALRIAIGRITQSHTTALYFERAAQAAGHEVTIIHTPDVVPAQGSCDLFLVVDPWFHGLRDLPRMDCPTAAVMIDVHRDTDTRAQFAQFFDHVFVVQRDFVERISVDHDSVHWLPLAGDPELHFIPDQERDLEVGFVGKLGAPGSARHRVLSQVLARFRTNDFENSQTLVMGPVYSRSRVVINKSIDGDVNMRVFEALAAGALLVTDRIGNGLDELLTEGVHYVGYDTAEEAVAQIERYLADEDARARIAQAGQAWMWAHHSYDARLARILEVVQAAGDARPAPARQDSPAQLRRRRARWARRRGTGAAAAARLVAEGLSPVAYGDLAIGLARELRRRWHQFRHRAAGRQA
ncbi:CgeB family protein [Mameliella alba]|uniref:Glycosyl transferase n=1 Tax=Mameliella alba TaxID=561184 RepID=A0A0B3S0P9_9RHOB|nr:glycosyltransferase [Mameliella alba]KHQ50166.1 Glycosyl transferase [Mameliella alba]